MENSDEKAKDAPKPSFYKLNQHQLLLLQYLCYHLIKKPTRKEKEAAVERSEEPRIISFE
jgi:hypothetical protein